MVQLLLLQTPMVIMLYQQTNKAIIELVLRVAFLAEQSQLVIIPLQSKHSLLSRTIVELIQLWHLKQLMELNKDIFMLLQAVQTN